ncbi:MAG: type I-C CRISPR-associated protein Cas5c [Clostridia bacterium]|nr:type I-C CRISPR-associated protein Cas5c [Clostridia bacterium]MDD4047557.1 type I-C CRISPR-associated protein Cas5c [Clostridia bacterium]
MGFGIRLKVFGDYACFTRPEMKVERVSYDVITPSAARGIIEAIYWKPAICWIIDRIHVINEIKFTNVRRNEVSQKISSSIVKSVMNGGSNKELYQIASEIRQQRASMILKDVCYIIEAHFEMTEKAGLSDTPKKHYNIALRRMRQGQCYYQPCLGTREFAANFEMLENEVPTSFYKDEIDLGWMLWDIDFQNDMTPIFYRAIMKDGIIEVKDLLKAR